MRYRIVLSQAEEERAKSLRQSSRGEPDAMSSKNPTTSEDIPYLRPSEVINSGPAFNNVPKPNLTMRQAMQLVSLNNGAGTHPGVQHEYECMRVTGLLFHNSHLLFVELADEPGQYLPFTGVWYKDDPTVPEPVHPAGDMPSALIHVGTGIKRGIVRLEPCVLHYGVFVGGDEIGSESELGVWTWCLQESWIVDGPECPPIKLDPRWYTSAKWVIYGEIVNNLDAVLPKWMQFGVVQAYDRYGEYVYRNGLVQEEDDDQETLVASENEEASESNEDDKAKKAKQRKQRLQKQKQKKHKKRH